LTISATALTVQKLDERRSQVFPQGGHVNVGAFRNREQNVWRKARTTPVVYDVQLILDASATGSSV